MKRCRVFALCALVLVSGCLTNAEQRAHQAACDLAAQPYDLLPKQALETKPTTPTPAKQVENAPAPDLDVRTTTLMQTDGANQRSRKGSKVIPVPPEIPGSEVPPLPPADIVRRDIKRVYPPLSALPEEPVARPGPDGKPYTLSALQHVAAVNSPELNQAASDVVAARANLIQVKAYPNPTVGWNMSPSSDNSVPSIQGPSISQTFKTAGKLKLAAAAAQEQLDNAELALKRARSDLATRVRSAYYALLVARESMRVNRALARFTDEVYLLHTELVQGTQAAPFEPTALRAQAYAARLAYIQAIQAYTYSWEQLVATLGLRTLPLSEVEGRIDAYIPYFDFDTVRAYVLQNHTDVLMARNGIAAAKYNLMLARVTPVPDVSLSLAVQKDFAVPPKQWSPTTSLSMPIPIWDQNRGNIMAAEAALMRASEEPHRVEDLWTNNLATAYMAYKQNLDALEYYRRYILPDQVQYYRYTFEAYHVNPTGNVNFASIVGAQQSLATSITTYLTILGTLWSSVVSVADSLQTDDLFQLAKPVPVPALPYLDKLLGPWPCCHECPPADTGVKTGCDACAAAVPEAKQPVKKDDAPSPKTVPGGS